MPLLSHLARVLVVKRTLLAFLGSLLLTNFANALPPLQHFVHGTIVRIEETELVVALTGAAEQTPTAFTIKAGRTRLRENGKNASLEKLKVGQSVRLYYRNELGTLVATEVAWKKATP